MHKGWNIQDGQAIADAGDWQVVVDPTSPSTGATLSRSAADASWHIYSLTPCETHALQPSEIYTRGDDLIASFAQSEADRFSFQLNWRLLPSTEDLFCGLELWLSIQTGLLDAAPVLSVQCDTGKAAPWQSLTVGQLDPDASESRLDDSAGFQSTGSQSTGLWLYEASDIQSVESTTANESNLVRVRTFGHFMEKGVIRRARMRFVLLPPTASLDQIRSAYRRYLSSPLPLTA